MFLTTNIYVPYDVNILANGVKEILKTIGTATNIGWIIFAALAGIYIVIMIVRKFMQ